MGAFFALLLLVFLVAGFDGSIVCVASAASAAATCAGSLMSIVFTVLALAFLRRNFCRSFLDPPSLLEY